jgi:hypothetical protein
MSELTFTGVNGGLLKWKAERSKHRAIGKKQRDTLNWPVLANAISRTSCTKGLQSDLLASPRIWRVSGVSEIVGASYTENRMPVTTCWVPGGAMIIDADEFRVLADERVAAAAKCNDPDAAAPNCSKIATKILELVRREMNPDIGQPFGRRRSVV